VGIGGSVPLRSGWGRAVKLLSSFPEAIALVGVGALGGFYVPPLVHPPLEVRVEAGMTTSTKNADAEYKPGAYFACRIAADASAYENRFDEIKGKGPAEAYARTTSEQAFGLRIAEDGKSIAISTGTTPFDASQAAGSAIPITLSGHIVTATGDVILHAQVNSIEGQLKHSRYEKRVGDLEEEVFGEPRT
jgi:hypothetical protein